MRITRSNSALRVSFDLVICACQLDVIRHFGSSYCYNKIYIPVLLFLKAKMLSITLAKNSMYDKHAALIFFSLFKIIIALHWIRDLFKFYIECNVQKIYCFCVPVSQLHPPALNLLRELDIFLVFKSCHALSAGEGCLQHSRSDHQKGHCTIQGHTPQHR